MSVHNWGKSLRASMLGLLMAIGPVLPVAAQQVLGEVSISAVPSTSSVVLYVAEQEGYFDEAGLNVKVVEFTSGAESERAMVSGAVDMGSGGVGTTLIMASKGIKARNVVLFQNKSIFTLVAHEGLDIGPGDLQALKGKKIGVSSPGSLTDLFLRIALRDAGIDPDRDVTIVATGGLNAHLPALKTGSVDAQMTWEPATVMITKGDGVGKIVLDLRTEDVSPALQNLLGSSLQATDAWLAKDNNLEKAKAAAKAIDRARQAIVKDPEIMMAPLKRIFPSLDESLLAEIAQIEASSYQGAITPEAIEHMSDIYVSTKIIDRPVSYDEIVDDRIAAEWLK